MKVLEYNIVVSQYNLNEFQSMECRLLNMIQKELGKNRKT